MYGNNPYMANQRMIPPYNQQPFQLIGAWVQGLEGAKGYQMSPNTVAVLLDSENEGMMYIKNTDNIGMSTLREYEYKEVHKEPKQNTFNLEDYVRKDELQGLIAKIAGGDNNESSVQSTV